MSRRQVFIYLFCALASILPLNAFATTVEQIHSILDGVKEHIDQKFDETPVETDPFPHLVIEEIFSKKLYEEISHYWPDTQEFVGDLRKMLPVTQGCLEDTTLTTEQKIFWRLFGEVIVNKYIKTKIIEKFAPYFNLKLNMAGFDTQQINRVENFTNLREDCLFEDSRFFTMQPHIDQFNIFAALLFYLPQDYEHQNFGTAFYEGPPNTNPNNINAENPVRFIEKIPYRPNTMVTYLQTPFSWHGVENAGYEASGYIRRLYFAPIFLSPEFMQKHYSGLYNRDPAEEYFFDHRFLCKKNWKNIWGKEDHYE